MTYQKLLMSMLKKLLKLKRKNKVKRNKDNKIIFLENIMEMSFLKNIINPTLVMTILLRMIMPLVKRDLLIDIVVLVDRPLVIPKKKGVMVKEMKVWLIVKIMKESQLMSKIQKQKVKMKLMKIKPIQRILMKKEELKKRKRSQNYNTMIRHSLKFSKNE